MKNLNNEELQNVSGGTHSDVPAGVPTLEDAMALLLAHGGKCKYCGMPVQEFVPLEIDDHNADFGQYLYYFKCSESRPLMAVAYDKDGFNVMSFAITSE